MRGASGSTGRKVPAGFAPAEGGGVVPQPMLRLHRRNARRAALARRAGEQQRLLLTLFLLCGGGRGHVHVRRLCGRRNRRGSSLRLRLLSTALALALRSAVVAGILVVVAPRGRVVALPAGKQRRLRADASRCLVHSHLAGSVTRQRIQRGSHAVRGESVRAVGCQKACQLRQRWRRHQQALQRVSRSVRIGDERLGSVLLRCAKRLAAVRPTHEEERG